MPRRHPKKPPKDLDLSHHFRLLTEIETPFDPTALFCQQNPTELEIGTGKGMFLTSASSSTPERNFLGIEVSAGYARMAASRLAALNVTNGVVIHGDAMHLVRHGLPNASLSGLHVYFPDPWWKARHRKRRILNPEFLRHAGRILQAGSQLHIWTDVEEYFNDAVLVVNNTLLFGKASNESAGDLENKYRTHFERRSRLAGDPVWRAVFTRNEKPPQQNRLIAKLPHHFIASPHTTKVL